MAIDGIMNIIMDVSTAIKAFKQSHPESGEKYNIFKVLEIDEREVLMCRVLADLLSPEGSHGCGNTFLHKFMERVMPERLNEAENIKISVYKEYPITEGRRIDIIFLGDAFFIPIEVKINAGEEKSQCYDYYHFAHQRDDKTKVIYLTKDGKYPSSYSLQSCDELAALTMEYVCPISFKTDLTEWLEEIIPMIKNDDVKNTIRQYKSAIHDFCCEEPINENGYIVDALVKSENNFRSALKITEAIDEAKAEIAKKLFIDFEFEMKQLLDTYGLEEETEFHWNEFTDWANSDFYTQSKSTYPGINYLVKNAKLSDGMQLWFRIEVDYRLFAMFAVFDPSATDENGEKGNQKDDISECEALQQELKKYLDYSSVQTTGWVVLWKYLPTGSYSHTVGIDKVPDFKEMNEAAIKLADDGYRKKFVKRCVAVMEQEFLKLLK